MVKNPLTPQEFLSLLRYFNVNLRTGNRPPRIGIAVSGGVDSMALAYLVSRCCAGGVFPKDGVIPYIVDHGARQESSWEAHKVLSWLKERLGFDHARILKVSWDRFGTITPKKFEMEARQLRYNVLAKACVADNVEKLLLGHQRDDQVETVLMRLISGSGYVGLRGIQRIAPIPEVADVWGSWNVSLWRPFIDVPKQRLYDTCEAAGVEWVEDPTNHDAKFTLRNAIRELFKDPFDLPVALRPDKILRASHKVEETCKGLEERAREAIADLKTVVDLSLGTVEITTKRSLAQKYPFRVMEQALHMLVSAVCPNPQVKKETNLFTVLRLFPDYRADARKLREDWGPGTVRFTANSLQWKRLMPPKTGAEKTKKSPVDTATYHRSGQVVRPERGVRIIGGEKKEVHVPDEERWLLSRQPYYSNELPVTTVANDRGQQPEYQLWDGRYWIKVKEPQQPLKIRPVLQDDFTELDPRRNQNLLLTLSDKQIRQRAVIKTVLNQRMEPEFRGIVPVLELSQALEVSQAPTAFPTKEMTKEIVAFPSLGWADPDVDCRIRHKSQWQLGSIPGVVFKEYGGFVRAATRHRKDFTRRETFGPVGEPGSTKEKKKWVWWSSWVWWKEEAPAS